MRAVVIVRFVTLSLVAVVVGTRTPVTTAAETYFSYNSTPGSWVGQGRVNYFISSGWKFSVNTSFGGGFVQLSARKDEPFPPADFDNYYWDLELEAPTGQTLQPGLYENARRYPFNGDGVGLTLSGNHRGNNENAGYFRIRQADFGLNQFAVDFRQYDEGDPNNWVDGKFRFNSTLVPEPELAGMLFLASLYSLPRCLRRKDVLKRKLSVRPLSR